MERTTRNQPIYMGKLTQLINFLKDTENRERNEALYVLKMGNVEEVKEMLRDLGERFPDHSLESWDPEQIVALEKDWDLIIGGKERGIFWTWDQAIRVRRLDVEGPLDIEP